jgi:hypothetical protein
MTDRFTTRFAALIVVLFTFVSLHVARAADTMDPAAKALAKLDDEWSAAAGTRDNPATLLDQVPRQLKGA